MTFECIDYFKFNLEFPELNQFRKVLKCPLSKPLKFHRKSISFIFSLSQFLSINSTSFLNCLGWHFKSHKICFHYFCCYKNEALFEVHSFEFTQLSLPEFFDFQRLLIYLRWTSPLILHSCKNNKLTQKLFTSPFSRLLCT